MLTFEELCHVTLCAGKGSAPLRQACGEPRSIADLSPLPRPNIEVSFDSSWEVLFPDVIPVESASLPEGGQ